MRLDHKRDLARRLGQPSLQSVEDASLLLHAWRRFGLDCFAELEGDFAAAIWDPAHRCLVLARDALGHRPLYFRKLPCALAFGSTAGALSCLAGGPRADLERVAALLTFVPEFGGRTFIKDVERVIPGHVLVVSAGGKMVHRRWWKPRLHPVRMDYHDAVEAMRAEVDRAVSAAVMSESPVVAAQLSGGHDSSLVTGSASRLIPPSKTLVAITGAAAGREVDLPPDSFDDVELAIETAAMLPRVQHVLALTEPESPLDGVERWLAADQPPLNPYSLGWLDQTYARARSAGASVMLVGYSGNFTTSYAGADQFAALAGGFRWATLFRELIAHRRRYGGTWAGLLSLTVLPWLPTGLQIRLARRRGRLIERFDERAFVRIADPRVRRAMRFARRHGLMTSTAPPRLRASALRFVGLQWADYGSFNHLVRARYGIELRDPLGARRVVELSLRLGNDHFYRAGEGKRMSKALLAGLVPERVYAEDTRRGMQSTNWRASAMIAAGEMAAEIDTMAADPQLAQLFDVDRLRLELAAWRACPTDEEASRAARDFLTSAVCAGRWARLQSERRCAQILSG